jgi:hypothetical protein
MLKQSKQSKNLEKNKISNKQQISSDKKLKGGIFKKECKYVSKRTFLGIKNMIKSLQRQNKKLHKFNKKAQKEFKKIILQKIKGDFVDSLDALIAEIWFEETIKRCIESETSHASILKVCEVVNILPLTSARIDPCSLSKKARQELVECLSKELGVEFVTKSCDESKKGLIIKASTEDFEFHITLHTIVEDSHLLMTSNSPCHIVVMNPHSKHKFYWNVLVNPFTNMLVLERAENVFWSEITPECEKEVQKIFDVFLSALEKVILVPVQSLWMRQ